MTYVSIEIFKTSVSNQRASEEILNLLKISFPHLKMNFDLDDCDKILRIQGHSFCSTNIIEILSNMGHHCERIE
ncbi:hypothetical protein VB264_07660 [Arcicella aquatica]|uniref:Uncharacterized protein n=1 Tax=Arcicella aquatica TaxID=217141 RepID=A0ABU5QKR6_9BACT|nr:hypothetical protein [Arcicella aquatica]MEA5257655.1 hypothetical protein [Arcicella aquatica]